MNKKIYSFLFVIFLLLPAVVSAANAELTCDYAGTYTYKQYEKDKTEDVKISCTFYDNDTVSCDIGQSSSSQPISNWGGWWNGNYTDIFVAKDYYHENKSCFPYMVFLDKGAWVNRYELYAADSYSTATSISSTIASVSPDYHSGIIPSVDNKQDEKSTILEHLDSYIEKLKNFKKEDDPWKLYECLDEEGKLDPNKANYYVCRERLSSFYSDLESWKNEINDAISKGTINAGNSKVKEFDDLVNSVRGQVNSVSDESLTSDWDDDDRDTTETRDPVESNLDISYYCSENNVARTLKFVGLMLFLAKIFVPALIIVMGCIDFGSAIISGKDDEIKKKIPVVIKRFIAGVIIFFIPTIIEFLFDKIENYNTILKQYDNCWTCVLHPDDCIIK